MVSLVSLQFILYFLWFLASSFIALFLPGWLILRKEWLSGKISSLSTLVLSIALSLTLWAGQGYVLGYTHLRALTYPYVVGIVILAIARRHDLLKWLRSLIKLIKPAILLPAVVLCLGVGLQLFQVVGSGLRSSDGVYLWRTHAYDGIFHLGLMEHMMVEFPPTEPSASGLKIANYHYWSDLAMAEQARIFHIPVSLLLFQFWPLLISPLAGFAVIALLRRWRAGTVFIALSLFFVYFGADTGYLVAYYIHHSFSFQYPVLDNGVTQFLNMPHAVAKAMFFCFLLALHYFEMKKTWKWGLVTALLCAVLFGLKIYFGLFAALAFFLFAVFSLINHVRLQGFALTPSSAPIKYGTFLALAGLMSLAIYLPPNRVAGGLGIYPLEWPKLFINPDNLDWRELRYKIAVATLEGDNVRLLFDEVVMALACLVAIHGTRLLGFIFTPQMLKFFGKKWMSFFVASSFLFTFLGLFTLQKSGGLNVYNFFAVSLSILAILSAFVLAQIIAWNRLVGWVLTLIVILITLPRIGYETQQMWDRYRGTVRDVIVVRPDLLAAYDYLRLHTNSMAVIQSSPANYYDIKSSYLAAFTGRQSYFSGEYLLDTHNQPYLERKAAIKSLFSLTQIAEIKDKAELLGIGYVYFEKNEDVPMLRVLAGQKPFYENSSVVVYDLKEI